MIAQRAVTGLSFCGFLAACTVPCSTNVYREVPSPGGRFRAVVFERDCGATTGFNRQVAIVPANVSAPDSATTIFVVDKPDTVTSAPDSVVLAVNPSWLNDDHLIIAHDGRARVLRQVSQLGSVKISYQSTP